MSFLDDVKNINPNDPGQWPLPIQFGVLSILFIIILGLGYYYDISSQREEIATLKSTTDNLKQVYEDKQKKVANLDALKDQMKEMQQSFGDMLRQLPNKTEVDALIVDISQEGLSAGLQFDLFKPGGEHPSEFYAELPISITVRGTYHQLGEFVSGIASLPRIVTTHNINIKKDKDAGSLTMSATVKTYRALDEEG